MKRIILTLIMIAPVIVANAQKKNPNPFLNDWSGPYGGVPAFKDYKLKDLKPAILTAIAEKLKEVDKIANNPMPPTFDNTIVAMEKAGKRLNQVNVVFGIYSSNLNSPEFEPIETEMTPKFSEVSNKIYQNEKLFERISKVYNSPETKKLTDEQQRLVWLYYSNFVREGAKADAKSKARVAAINQELAGLFTKFSQNQLADENNYYLELKTDADFDGLPEKWTPQLSCFRLLQATPLN
jgi:peptidyl-dipeptidase Dcp